MNKQKFTNIVQNHTFADNDDVKPFLKLVEQYPYSQILHTIIAKHHNEVKSDQAKASIQRAAIYATDRVVLKKIIQSKPAPVITDTPSAPTPKTEEPPKIESTAGKEPIKTFVSEPTGKSDIDELRKNLFNHLEQLQESKKPFTTENQKNEKKIVTKTKTKSNTKEKPALKKKDKAKQKPATPKNKTVKKDESPLSQKEQVELIEKFIKSPPIIPKGKVKSDGDQHQEDLSVNSTKIEEDFASENLAQILIKQGNKEKAIDIYKKLIWKFPQKKAYFATQIEGLKK